MAVIHSNPKYPNRTAHAPYNFVSLPEDVVQAQQPLLPLNTYKDGISGRIHCTMTTCSPTYVRGMLSQDLYDKLKDKELTDEDKKKIAPFFTTKGKDHPCIPGSSIRGMLRSLVEIVSYSRIRWVSNEQAFFYRMLATGDPLSQQYRNFSKQIRGGVVHKTLGGWEITQSPKPIEVNREFDYRLPHFVVDNKQVTEMIPELSDFRVYSYNEPQDKPHQLIYRQISFNAEKVSFIARGRTFYINRLTDVGDVNSGLTYNGYLLSSGNMLENQSEEDRARRIPTMRHNHAVILEPGENAPSFPIDPKAAEAYKDNLTEFQKKRLGKNGVLVDGRPVFFVPPTGRNGAVIFFGHSPNFRIPACVHSHVSHIRDFIPKSALGCEEPDMTDVIFGWTEEKDLGPKGQHKGRIRVSDAHFLQCNNPNGLWYETEPVAPKILASPKPSAFQNYLCQDENKDHDPDRKPSIAHYGTDPEETQIRGTKFYWAKGESPDFKEPDTDEIRSKNSQYTRIEPLNPDVTFEFDIHFDQLRPEELGALCWVLDLPDEHYQHRIGMGKPHGMGVVKIKPELYIINREQRYQALFRDGEWFSAETQKEMAEFKGKFEKFVLGRINPNSQSLADEFRIKELLAMLTWQPGQFENGNPNWRNATEYMTLEEFKERPVLPDPLRVMDKVNHVPPEEYTYRSRNFQPGTINKRLQKCDLLNAVVCFIEPIKDSTDKRLTLTVDEYAERDELFFTTIVDGTKARNISEGDKVSVRVVEIDQSDEDIEVKCDLDKTL